MEVRLSEVAKTVDDEGYVTGDANSALILSVAAFLATLDVEDVTESNVLPLVTLSLEDHAETLNHVEVRRLLGLPRADRWSFDAE